MNKILICISIIVFCGIYFQLPTKIKRWAPGAVSLLILQFYAPFSTPVLFLVMLATWKLTMNRSFEKNSIFFTYLLFLVISLISLKLLTQNGVIKGNWKVVLGLSYFTFKSIHIAIESRVGRLKNLELSEFLTFMFLLPTYTAGPIEPYQHFVQNRTYQISNSQIQTGIGRILIGFILVFGLRGFFDTSRISPSEVQNLWIYMTLYFFSMYLEFSGYTHIAIGISQLFGIKIVENFNYPLMAKDIIEFWNRWHMSLGNWCKNHVYMPVLGLTRQPLVSLAVTFSIIGVWHQITINRLIWGLYHAVWIAIFYMIKKYWKANGPTFALYVRSAFLRVGGLAVVISSMTFLVAEDIKQSTQYAVKTLFRLFSLEVF